MLNCDQPAVLRVERSRLKIDHLNNLNFPDVTYDELLASHSPRSACGKPASQTSVVFVFIGGNCPMVTIAANPTPICHQSEACSRERRIREGVGIYIAASSATPLRGRPLKVLTSIRPE